MGIQHLVHAAIALACALACERFGPLGSASPAWLLVGLLVPPLLAQAARRRFLRGRHRLGGALMEVLRHSSVLIYGLGIHACDWIELSTRIGGGELIADGTWPQLGLALALLPWVALEFVSVEAQVRARAATREHVRALRAYELRMRAMALAPLVLLYGALLLVGLNETWRVRIGQVGLLGALHAAAVVGIVLLTAPLVLRYTMDVRALPQGALRTALEHVGARARFRCLGLYAWNTEGRMANAAILGLTPRTRAVVFTDALLEQLSLAELCAVYAHEIGHAARNHLLALAGLTIVMLVGGGWLIEACLPPEEWWSLLGLLPVLGAWFAAVGWLSRRFELEADLHAFDVLDDPRALVSALQRVSGMHAEDRDSWRHFSSARRIQFLIDVARETSIGAALGRRLRAWRVAIFAATTILLTVRAAGYARSWREDQAWADLRLGEFERAAARGAASPDGSLEALLALAAELPADPAAREPQRLLERAEADYARGAYAKGRAWLELSAWRGG
ncbi:MAG: hypothetical protein FJ299_09895, partial [Planctomycetes bacterium]|nr:hypothetical protein [Planctomycetota bacterium]